MNDTQDQESGGRLRRLGPGDIDEAQRPLYDRMMTEQVPWARQSGFEAATGDGRLLGPFNALLYSPATGGVNMDLFSTEKKTTSLSERVHEIVILAVGAVWQAGYELYAHAAVGRGVGLEEAVIADLVAGRRPAGLPEPEMAAFDFARELAENRRVDAATYARTVASLGERGAVDIVLLAGEYMTICALLNTFEVPIPAPGG